MARRVITIEEKIEKQTAEVTKAKKKYDEELDKLHILIEKRKKWKAKSFLKPSVKAEEHSRRSWISSSPNRIKTAADTQRSAVETYSRDYFSGS